MADFSSIISLLTSNDLIAGSSFIICAAVLILFTTFVSIGALLNTRKLKQLLLAEAQHIEDLTRMVSAYGQTLIAMGSSNQRVERKITEFTDRNLEIQSQLAIHRSFEEASRLVRDGGSARSLVESCGLNDAEADLMVRLHQREPGTRQHLKQAALSAASDKKVTTVTAEDKDSESLSESEIRLKEALGAAQSRPPEPRYSAPGKTGLL